MPSDCQCGSACDCTIVKKEVIGNKEATRRLKKLEDEVKELKSENRQLKAKLEKKTKTRGQIIKELKRHLDNV